MCDSTPIHCFKLSGRHRLWMNRALWIDQNPSQLGKDFQALFTSQDDPLLRHVRTRIKSRQTNGVIERFFGTLNEHR